MLSRYLAILTSAAAALLPLASHADYTPPPPTYRAGDYGGGQVLSILPPGEHGLYNAADQAAYQATGARPAGSIDQLAKYANLLYAPPLTNDRLADYFNDESFGVKPSEVTRTERPDPSQPVVIYRDTHDVPHIYGDTLPAMTFGAGYAAAEDRLFLIDVLRHYGGGTLSAFLGPSCANEQMDHDELLLTGYTQAEKQAQVDNLPGLYPELGGVLLPALQSYVAGINAYIARAQADPALLPADYAAAAGPPQPWSATDIVDIASLVGGIFGKGGGAEVLNSALMTYLQSRLGPDAGASAFAQFKEQNDPDAPTTITDRAFPYGIQGSVDPSTTAILDSSSLHGGPTGTTPGCSLTAPSPIVAAVAEGLLALPRQMSNAILVDAAHSASGHPLAVMGPQVAYFAPQILMIEDLHGPDFAAFGASFPGTNLVVELGRGVDYAWSATSAETDNVDQRVELVCAGPGESGPQPEGKFYSFNGQCLPMSARTISETAVTKPGGLGAPVQIDHHLYTTVHGVVQGWTTVGGRPVAVVNQRSTYGHELDSAIGFARWAMPSKTYDSASWMQGAAGIQYTFNWFYIDSRDIAYYQSGLDPIRPANVDPNLPAWGTGVAEWQGFLGFDAHPHEVNPPSGRLISWNNKPAPGFSASDADFQWGPVHRAQSLEQDLQRQLETHGGKLTRADVVMAMETAAVADLTGRQVLPDFLALMAGRPEPPGVQLMLAQLTSWLAAEAPRKKASAGDSQYQYAAAVAIMDELYPRLVRKLFDGIFQAGGVYSQDGLAYGYSVLPMEFAQTPNGQGSRHGSAYIQGYEGYVQKLLRQMLGRPVGQPFTPAVTSQLCGAGLPACPAAFDAALADAYAALVTANGGGTGVASWTQNTVTRSAGVSLPAYDSIHFRAIGVAGVPDIDWQNRPTFQQVVEFPSHRPAGAAPGGGSGSGSGGSSGSGPGSGDSAAATGGGGAGSLPFSSGPPRRVPPAPLAPLIAGAALIVAAGAGRRRRRR